MKKAKKKARKKKTNPHKPEVGERYFHDDLPIALGNMILDQVEKLVDENDLNTSCEMTWDFGGTLAVITVSLKEAK